MITAPLPRASPSGTGRLSMIIPRYYGLTITNTNEMLFTMFSNLRSIMVLLVVFFFIYLKKLSAT